jgi:hypothetical protein
MRLVDKSETAASMVLKKSSNLGVVLGLIEKLLSD